MAHRRSIFLINRKFQLRFAFYVCSWLLALSFVYPLIVYNLFDYFIRFIAHDPSGPPIEGLQNTREEVIWLLVSAQLIFLGISFLISIFISHRIAGPLHKLRTFFMDAKEGKIRQTLSFRKSDHFQDLAEGYNSMITGIQTLVDKQGDLAMSAASCVEKALANSNPEDRKTLEEAIAILKKIPLSR